MLYPKKNSKFGILNILLHTFMHHFKGFQTASDFCSTSDYVILLKDYQDICIWSFTKIFRNFTRGFHSEIIELH